MAQNEIHVDDIGTVFTATIMDGNDIVDVSGSTTLQLKFKKPGGTLLTKSAGLVTDGTDGQISYTAVDGDLDECGRWRLQAFLVLIGGNEHHSDICRFRVHDNLVAG